MFRRSNRWSKIDHKRMIERKRKQSLNICASAESADHAKSFAHRSSLACLRSAHKHANTFKIHNICRWAHIHIARKPQIPPQSHFSTLHDRCPPIPTLLQGANGWVGDICGQISSTEGWRYSVFRFGDQYCNQQKSSKPVSMRLRFFSVLNKL